MPLVRPLLVSLKDRVAKDLDDQNLSDAFRQVELWSATVTKANLAGLPPPTRSSSTVSYTDPTGQVWVAKAGVHGGAYRLARDVLHAFWYRTGTWTTSTTAVNFRYDTTLEDPYGIFNGTTFTAPTPGIYRMDMFIGCSATATGQWLTAMITNASAAVFAYGWAQSSSANFITPYVNITRPAAAGEQWLTAQQSSTALVGRPAVDMCRLTVDYLGTG